MLQIKIQYDPIERIFKLISEDFRTLLEGDALYDLAMPLMFEETEEAPVRTAWTSGQLVHA